MRLRRSRGGTRRRKLWPLGATIGIVAILICVMTVPGLRSGPVGRVLGGIIAPVQQGYAYARRQVADWMTMMDKNNTLLQENRALKEEQDQISVLRQQISELQKENQRLQDLNNAAENMDGMTFINARIIAKSPESWYSTVLINRGSQDGIEKDMAVITGDGLFGRVIEVNSNYSRVMTIVDGRSALSVMVERTRDNGMVKGQMLQGSERNYCRLMYLQDDSALMPGDRIVTTQMDGILPKGLIVGEVVEVTRGEGDERYALVKPSADIGRAEDVLVVMDRPESVGIAGEN